MNNFGLVFLFLAVASAKLCYLPNQGINTWPSGTKVTDESLVNCPQPEDPYHFSECCDEGQESLCCEPKHHAKTALFGSNNQLLIITSVGVITMCLAVMVVVLVCCFSSQCPLYTCTACPPNYQHDEAVAFTTKEEMMKLNGMPDEECLHPQSYEPNAVKIRPVCDV